MKELQRVAELQRRYPSPLHEVLKRLRGQKKTLSSKRFYIPAIWLSGQDQATRSAGPGAQVGVNPCVWLGDTIDHIQREHGTNHDRGYRSLSCAKGVSAAGAKARHVRDGDRERVGGDWFAGSTCYSMMIRTTTAWDHDGIGSLHGQKLWTETGTFLKSIGILPFLRRMGIDVLYLLPVSQISQAYRKGEVGCPYSARDFFAIEPSLHDRLLGIDADLVDLEFAAFIDAAHLLGMRVMVDLAPRTAARDSQLILEHPDWFYWIDAKEEQNYRAPFLPQYDPCIPSPAQMREIIQQPAVCEHLDRFRVSPDKTIGKKRWRQFVEHYRGQRRTSLLDGLRREFGLVTPPGFSDVLNDTQPPWTDVTFLRLYRDHPSCSRKCLHRGDKQPPYVFTDTIKSSVFPGKMPNKALWQVLSDILPFYQQYGVDGARVDMGHALPPTLQQMIVDKPRRIDPDFCFLAEEFDVKNAARAKRDGYNAVIGASWAMQPRYKEGQLHTFVNEVLPASKLPVFAAVETPDTPRVIRRPGGLKFSGMISVLNYFLPNCATFVNSGQECLERQPMNLGLDASPRDRFSLDKRDPYYGKLAFFDYYQLHWDNPGTMKMVGLLEQAAGIKSDYQEMMRSRAGCVIPQIRGHAEHTISVCWKVKPRREFLMIAANLNMKSAVNSKLVGVLPDNAGRTTVRELLRLRGRAQTEAAPLRSRKSIPVALAPADVVVMLVEVNV